MIIEINVIFNSFKASSVLGSQFIYFSSIYWAPVPRVEARENHYCLHGTLSISPHIFPFGPQGNPER